MLMLVLCPTGCGRIEPRRRQPIQPSACASTRLSQVFSMGKDLRLQPNGCSLHSRSALGRTLTQKTSKGTFASSLYMHSLLREVDARCWPTRSSLLVVSCLAGSQSPLENRYAHILTYLSVINADGEQRANRAGASEFLVAKHSCHTICRCKTDGYSARSLPRSASFGLRLIRYLPPTGRPSRS